MKELLTPEFPLILAIESSCDDTSVAILKGGKVLSNIVASQSIHQEYGGVFPELAARAHQENIIPTLELALKKANITLKELHAIAFTQGPGLVGSLLVANAFAKSLSMALQIPLIGVNHLKGHILAHFLEDPTKENGLEQYESKENPIFPFLCLLISGGHTQLVWVERPENMRLLGETQDDAAGECFDKIGKILGLTYPAGPWVDEWAQKGDPHKFTFPQPKMEGFHFSFSGLKTAFLYFIQAQTKNNPDFIAHNLADICASIQHTIVEILYKKTMAALKETGAKHLAISGGVAANGAIRQKFQSLANEHLSVHFPARQYCTDNAAMIGIAAYYQFLHKDFTDLSAPSYARVNY